MSDASFNLVVIEGIIHKEGRQFGLILNVLTVWDVRYEGFGLEVLHLFV